MLYISSPFAASATLYINSFFFFFLDDPYTGWLMEIKIIIKHSVYTSHSINLSPSYHSKPSWKDKLCSASYLLHSTLLPPLPFHWVFSRKDLLVDMFSWFFPVIPYYLVPQEYLSKLTTLLKLFVFSISGASLRTFPFFLLLPCLFPKFCFFLTFSSVLFFFKLSSSNIFCPALPFSWEIPFIPTPSDTLSW